MPIQYNSGLVLDLEICEKMENPTSIVRNGGIKLPIGYRFRPTDEELIVHYLTRKVQSVPFPAQVIPELNVFQTHPLHLPGDSTEKRFFFWKRKGKWKKSRGMTESGYWKPMGKEKHVVSFESNRAIGVKKSFVFYEGKRPRGLRTRWVMREYRLLESQTRPNSGLEKKFVRGMEDDWVVCKIYQKKRTSKKNVVETDMNSKSNKVWSTVREISPIVVSPIVVMDVDVDVVGSNNDLGPPQPSSSSCSSTGVSFCELGEPKEDSEEITSAYNISSSFFA